ncbi:MULTISPECIES: DUF397 domain-containing protein [Nocardiopsis]|uniref:DUF397 domain-containing protein n=1 Tax=Nocardiopsis dassonvillei (strain ATCC 23218 / DSM 43111 / CIP 107115 / JCM 7437 / KCTC 9190 / NBRC 14626 / NCTC 10488 / NRRL B-5397 / IMRU 509) TaxID=446468 RepID=D7B6P0_NOCDD|nr:DUF397 domain-containing protein [Nocardiopsis dassonvillei]ADH69327.1 protein of unknown function DUF397 [Nocardiopsis dassonvillei subsp. dassonvillei DSM 43111]APC37349.1 DUF397 domain-containing protein [Nocardiopsis dassonvillei]NKY81076.1 DUF397 domain-containing protein [Nocardiopsis dassonvillei]VEI89837.1 Domain of uncharacterised function (DUF397) [Nocardiopsis dassonvillei]
MNDWCKSSYSANAHNCVEAREYAGGVDVRDTQNREHGYITVPAGQWVALLAGLERGL